MLEDKFHDECGIFGMFGHKKAARAVYLGLFALQHRGQESAGIVASYNRELHSYKGMGLVTEVFNQQSIAEINGNIAIGHVRYSTAGDSRIENAQPLVINSSKGQIAIGHNGNLVNTKYLREQLEKNGAIFQTTSDTEVIAQLIARSKMDNLIDAISDALFDVKGAYSLLLMTPDELIGIRDPLGVRPLCLGKLDNAYVLASESCALDLVKAKYLREVEPGEMVIINQNGLTCRKAISFRQYELFPLEIQKAFCIFEYIYFARPDSFLFNKSVYHVRKRLGQQLAREYPVNADVIIPIPDSGVSAALGVAEDSNIPYQLGLIRNLYVGRTFINPKQDIRELGVAVKLNPVKEVIKNKRVVVVDDSIVRGTTCQKIMKLIRESGAREIHLRISSPPIKFPCYYGIDTPTTRELIAATHSLEQIKGFMNVDSLGYLSIEGLLKATDIPDSPFCLGCFTGSYPIGGCKKCL